MNPEPKKLHNTYKVPRVAVVVPMYKRSLSDEEAISMAHVRHYLARYDKYLITPRSLDVQIDSFHIKKFSDSDFVNTKSYSRLLLTKKFYEQFSSYDYILIYQLDSLVFSDQLQEWCQKNYDYVGAPWFKEHMVKRYEYPDAVGNGGLSLRNVSSFIRIIDSARKPWYKILAHFARIIPMLQSDGLKNYLKALRGVWRQSAAHRTELNEDRYWSFKAPQIDPSFRIPSVDIGLQFAFEIAPRYCFEKNHNKLPFGCHAWGRYDKKFWLPYLLTLPLQKIPQ